MKRILMLCFTVVCLSCLFALCVSAEGTECTTHIFESAQITTRPSCNSDGELTYTCSECGVTETKVIPATHTYHSEVTAKATCTTEGKIVHTCNVCGDTYTETTAVAHAYRQKIEVAPTCTTDGVATNTCSLCGDTVENVTVFAAHNYTNVVELYAPSCFFEGLIQFDCSVCGKTGLTENVAKTHENEAEIVKAATCTTDGLLRHTCLYCNATHTDIIAAKHTYDILNGKPTSIVYKDFTATGVKYFVCDNCDSQEGVIANPIFIFSGYSATEYDSEANNKVEIACGYTVNLEALQEYQDVMNGTLQFGIVGAFEKHVGVGKAPLVSETGEPINNISENVTTDKISVKKIQLVTETHSTLNGRLINIDYDNHTTYFYLCLYVYDGTRTVYISDDSCREVPLPISYSMLNDGGDHDDVAVNTAKFGDIEYSTIKGTTPTQERLDMIGLSSSSYKTEAATADSARDENTVASIGNLGQWVGTVPNANELLNYYLELGGDATHYDKLDIQALITKNTVAKKSWQTSINNILRAAELMAIKGETVNIDQTTETQVQLVNSNGLWSSNRDWYLTFIDGFYYTDTDLNNLTVSTNSDGERVFQAEIVYTVIDYYSFQEWAGSTDSTSFLLWGPTKAELAQLHLDGNALDFLIESTITYTVEWTEGERIADDGMLNQYEAIEVEETVNSGILEIAQ